LNIRPYSAVTAATLACLIATQSWAQEPGTDFTPDYTSTDGSYIIAELETVSVTGDRGKGSPTGLSPADALNRIQRRPGAVDIRPAEDFTETYVDDLADTMFFAPGVLINAQDGQELKITIRGNGIGTSFERRGLSILRDGVPITSASGSTNVQEVDPLAIRFIEIYRGGNGLRYGSGSLGGAINLATPTGLTEDHTIMARIEGGSFDNYRAHVALADGNQDRDYYVSVSARKADGFREHNETSSLFLNSNFGWRPNDKVETRFYVEALQSKLELAGGASLEQALEEPKAPAVPVTIGPFFPGGPITVLDPGPVADDWQRDLKVIRVVNRTVISLDSTEIEVGGFYVHRDLLHPITAFAGVVDQVSNEGGLFVRANGNFGSGARQHSWTLGIETSYGATDAKRFFNVGGKKGALRSQADQKSFNMNAYGQVEIFLNEAVAVIAGTQVVHTERDYDVSVGSDPSNKVSYTGVAPRIGLLWDVSDQIQIFANITKSYEAPSFAELTGGGGLNFTGLEAQSAWSFELGTRGAAGPVAWDLTLYRSHLDNELLKFGAPGARGFVSFTENANNTIHQGIELGLDISLAQNFFEARGGALVWRSVYTFSDFNFDDDAQFGDNRVAGIPEHVYRGELRYGQEDLFSIGLNLTWVMQSFYADFANTSSVPSYALLGFNAAFDLSENIQLIVSGENLTNKRYIAGVSTNANQSLEQGRIFVPGEGRAFYVGVIGKF
jgi:iron complex outermembrane recepter protein